MTMRFDLSGKTVLVTGAASGIGKELAEQFAYAGARVGIADINIDDAQKVADALTDKGACAIALKMDVGNENEVENAVQLFVGQFGSVDVLISNAGIQIIESIDRLSLEQWKKMLSIHLDGAFLTTRAVLKHMYADKRGGTVIYMGSVHAHEASVLKAPYITAKHGLLGLCRVLAKEGAKYNVRSHVICPGFVKTPLVEKQIPEQAKEKGITEEEVVNNIMLGNTVDGEFTTVGDIAQLALFLAACPNNVFTGQSFIASHGWCMK